MFPFQEVDQTVMTVTGEEPSQWDGPVDAHNHVWINPVAGAATDSPRLGRAEPILQELQAFRAAGGGGILDCQPAGCGRDGRQLQRLSKGSGVPIVCCTGFHRQRYYSPDSPLWRKDTQAWERFMTSELLESVMETSGSDEPIRAGFIKVAAEASLEDTPRAALEAAAQAAVRTQAAVEVHTEQGAQAETILAFLISKGVSPRQIVLCHMDKRPDFMLHRDLAEAGVLLEYDTFYRPRYEPQKNLWPLLLRMISSGYSSSIALATDMAEPQLWSTLGEGPGLTGFIHIIQARLIQEDIPAGPIQSLMGGNIISRLAKPRIH
jgi:predicted metal-dependent phosphotriesterase family hydrolase